ncbi:cupin domain-containing protein, partial [Salmonella enterica]|uniref:cupin domain-containing protein n=1 Tax=Salmonella enterica TaxID=28901 RepID=UPI0035CD20A7
MSSVQFRRIAMGSAAGVGFANPVGRGQFHFVGRGPAWLRSPDGQTHALGTGDALLIPRGGHHAMLSASDTAPQDVATFDPALSDPAGAHRGNRADEV